MENVQDDILLALSTAVHLTVVVPSPTVAGEGTSQVRLLIPELSVALTTYDVVENTDTPLVDVTA